MTYTDTPRVIDYALSNTAIYCLNVYYMLQNIFWEIIIFWGTKLFVCLFFFVFFVRGQGVRSCGYILYLQVSAVIYILGRF